VLEGRAEELPKLLPDLAYSMMLPYLGHSAAEREIAHLRTDTGGVGMPEASESDAVVSIRAGRA
jgi:hypothetical protein